MTETTSPTGYTNSVERAIDILEYLATRGRGVSVVELSNKFHVNRTSIYSILKVLINKGYVRKVSDGRYNLTGRMFEFGQQFRNSFPIVHVARTVGLSLDLGYICHMNIAMYFSGTSALLMNSINVSSAGSLAVDRSMVSGQSVPLHATSLGKVLLAYMPPAESKALLSQIQYEPYARNTVKDAEALRQQMQAAVDKGYAVEEQEFYDDTYCVAAPVFDQTNTVIAACSLTCNTLTLASRDVVIRDVLRIAKNISTALGSTWYLRQQK